MNAGIASVHLQSPLAVSAACHLLDVIRVAELAASGGGGRVVTVLTHVVLVDVGAMDIINVAARVHTPRVSESSLRRATSPHMQTMCEPAGPSPRKGWGGLGRA